MHVHDFGQFDSKQPSFSNITASNIKDGINF